MSEDTTSDATMITRLERVERRLDTAEAIEAARGLLHTYARACDTKDPHAVAACFTLDATLTAGTAVFTGREAILGFYEGALQGNSCHVVGTARMTQATDGSLESSSVFGSFHLAGDIPQIHYGTYVDRIIIVDGASEFAARRITITGSVPIPQGTPS